MTDDQCVFAFPAAEWTQAEVLALARDAMRDLASQLDLPPVFAKVADVDGAWHLWIATPAPGGKVLGRGYFLDAWPPPFEVVIGAAERVRGVRTAWRVDRDVPDEVVPPPLRGYVDPSPGRAPPAWSWLVVARRTQDPVRLARACRLAVEEAAGDPAVLAEIEILRTKLEDDDDDDDDGELDIDVTSSDDEAFGTVRVAADGVVLMRIAHYPHAARRLDELLSVPAPPSITPEGCDAYAARLAAEIAKHPDLAVSVVALGRTLDGLHGWLAGVARVWRYDDDEVVSPSPYLDVPGYPAPLIRHGITQTMISGEWFEAEGDHFVIVMAHPLPDAPQRPEVGIIVEWRL